MRAHAIRQLSAAVANGTLDFRPGRLLADLERELCLLPGIGPWTASMVAMRVFGEPDAFPAGDLVLKRRLANFPEGIVESWRPLRAYAAMTLWTLPPELPSPTGAAK